MIIQNLAQYLPTSVDSSTAWVLLGLRLIWSAILLNYSLPMVKQPFHWMDLGGKPSGFPGFVQALGAVSVFGGGLAIAFGFLTPLAAIGLAIAMIVALFLHFISGHPFVKPTPDSPGESYDNSLLYLALSLLFIILGPGTFSLDALLVRPWLASLG
jgi:putative oxidoreductase